MPEWIGLGIARLQLALSLSILESEVVNQFTMHGILT